MPFFQRTPARHIRPASLAFILLCGLFILLRLYLDWATGGFGWKQGDWLINMHNGPVRRGPFGSGLIVLSDVLGVSPLDMAVLTQGALVLTLLLTVGFVFARILKDPAYSIIVFSPAFFLIFWVADPPGSLRKELIAFAAMALLLVIPLLERSRGVLAAFSMALFLASCIGHEANVLLTPAFAAIFVIVVEPDVRKLPFRLASMAFLGLVGLTLLWAILHPGVESSQEVCEPLIQRGVAPDLCTGAISWLERGKSYGAYRIVEGMLQNGRIFLFLLAYAAVAGPFLYLNALHQDARFLNIAFLLLLVPLLPLYLVAEDWGRWMDLHIVSYSFLLAAMVLTGRQKMTAKPNMAVLSALVFVNLLWAPAHAPGLPSYPAGIVVGGVAGQFLSSVGSYLPALR